ncbi:piggyBac transposable element-derived protein 4-like [Vespa crabro]|uniref:piggyBac transposable element-derived protein 4-like n=1 Tax=Vespa crabro TaxID=7445 RepID=UPI001F020CE8|nr:piggyBac transposable element-derived protein 4-like [Vespa crabro]
MAKKRSIEESSISRNLKFSSSEDEFYIDFTVVPITDSDIDDELSQNENINSDSDDSREWENITKRDDIFQQIKFTVSPKVTGPQISPNIVESIDSFKLYFTEELVNIIKETNNYVNSKIKNKFEYWTTNNISRVPFYSDTFTRDRFNQIFWMLHLKKIPPGHPSLKTRIQRANETVVQFKGKIGFITYNPIKSTKWGIRIYVLIDSKSGYVYFILPYYGSITTENLPNPELPITTRIVLYLYQKLLEKILSVEGYHMFTDRYFTSLSLATELLKLKCHLTGMIKPN